MTKYSQTNHDISWNKIGKWEYDKIFWNKSNYHEILWNKQSNKIVIEYSEANSKIRLQQNIQKQTIK